MSVFISPFETETPVFSVVIAQSFIPQNNLRNDDDLSPLISSSAACSGRSSAVTDLRTPTDKERRSSLRHPLDLSHSVLIETSNPSREDRLQGLIGPRVLS